MGRPRRLPPGPAGHAARLVLSGALKRRITILRDYATTPESHAWSTAGMQDVSPAIHQLLDRALEYAKARRYRAAIKTYDTAEALAFDGAPTIRFNRLRARAERLETETEELRPLAESGRRVRAGARTSSGHRQENSAERWAALQPIIDALVRTKPREIVHRWSIAGYLHQRLRALQAKQAREREPEVNGRLVAPIDWLPSQKSLDRRLRSARRQ